MTWAVITDEANELRHHVIPEDDAMPHVARWTNCNCGPRLDPWAPGGLGTVIVHHSLDGREAER